MLFVNYASNLMFASSRPKLSGTRNKLRIWHIIPNENGDHEIDAGRNIIEQIGNKPGTARGSSIWPCICTHISVGAKVSIAPGHQHHALHGDCDIGHGWTQINITCLGNFPRAFVDLPWPSSCVMPSTEARKPGGCSTCVHVQSPRAQTRTLRRFHTKARMKQWKQMSMSN